MLPINCEISSFITLKRLLKSTGLKVIYGTIILSLLSQITVPFYPIPLTLQNLGVFCLTSFLGFRVATSSTFLYLLLAWCGLPILTGGASGLMWHLLPQAGYLVGMALAPAVISWGLARSKSQKITHHLACIVLAQGVIFTLGIANLCRFIDFKQSLIVGLYPFVFIDVFKTFAAAICLRFCRKA